MMRQFVMSRTNRPWQAVYVCCMDSDLSQTCMKYTHNSVCTICMLIVYLFVALHVYAYFFYITLWLHIDIYTLLAVVYDVVEAD